MKFFSLFALFFLSSCLLMIGIDYYLGPRAEFLNAFSVVERLIGQVPSVSDSLIASKYGAAGELLIVVAVNVITGSLLAILARFRVKLKHGAD